MQFNMNLKKNSEWIFETISFLFIVAFRIQTLEILNNTSWPWLFLHESPFLIQKIVFQKIGFLRFYLNIFPMKEMFHGQFL